MTSREMLVSFESQMALEAEKYLALARKMLAGNATAVMLLDGRADEIRELAQIFGLAAVRVWPWVAVPDMVTPPAGVEFTAVTAPVAMLATVSEAP